MIGKRTKRDILVGWTGWSMFRRLGMLGPGPTPPTGDTITSEDALDLTTEDAAPLSIITEG